MRTEARPRRRRPAQSALAIVRAGRVERACAAFAHHHRVLALTDDGVGVGQKHRAQAIPVFVRQIGDVRALERREGFFPIRQLRNRLNLDDRHLGSDMHRHIGFGEAEIREERAEPEVRFDDAFPGHQSRNRGNIHRWSAQKGSSPAGSSPAGRSTSGRCRVPAAVSGTAANSPAALREPSASKAAA